MGSWVQDLLFLLCLILLVPMTNVDSQRLPNELLDYGLQCPEAIFGFGASLSDTGELLQAYPASVLAGNEPYGMTFPGYPTGRFSDGKLVIDFMAEAFGLPLLSPFFYNQHPDFRHGVNFCASGATARSTPAELPFFLSQQIDHAVFFYKQAAREDTSEPCSAVPNPASFTSKGLYFLNIGTNDLNYQLLAGAQSEVIREIVAPETASNISVAITRLYEEVGARQFLVLNILPVGCAPFALDRLRHRCGPVDEYGCLSSINELAQAFNLRIKAAVQDCRNKLSGAVIVYADIHEILLNITRQHEAYGFKEAFKPCCGSTTGPECGVSGARLCDKPSDYVSWDGIHFTEAVYRIVADSILTGQVLDPPVNLEELCHLQIPKTAV